MTEDFRKRLETIFHEEASEHLHHLASGLIAWEKSGEDASSPLGESLYRASHSLKGASRAVGYLEMEALCQAMEGAFSSLRAGGRAPAAEVFDLFNASRAQLERMLSGRRRGQPPQAPDAALIGSLKAVEKGEAAPAPGSASARDPLPPSREDRGKVAEELPTPPEPEARTDREPGDGGAPEKRSSVRVSLDKLDSLGARLDDLVSARNASARLLALLDEVERASALLAERLRQDARRKEGSGGADLPDSGNAQAAGELASLARKARHMGRDNRSQLDQVAGSLAAGVRDALMIPLGELLDVFPKLARDLAVQTGKRIQVFLSGTDREMEKALAEQLREILLHLVRNALDHGIETPEERAAAGKPPQGRLGLAVSLLPGSRLAIEVSDDGRGLDLQNLRRAAVRAGLLTPEAAEAMGGPETLDLAFRSGLTTRGEVSTLSGRGLGLAIVRERIEAMGGAVSVESGPGRGARFLLTMPSRRTTARGVVVEAGGRTMVVPTAVVRKVARLKPEGKAAGRPGDKARTVRIDGDWLEPVPLSAFLGLEEKPSRSDSARRDAVLVVEAGGIRRAFSVNAVLGEQEIVVQALGAPLDKVAHVSGAAQLLSGEHALVLDLGALGSSGVGARRAAAAAAPAAKGPRRVLVVEDSITSRTLIKSLLETAGYSVSLAVDGLAAWNFLEKGGPDAVDAVVSDVEMPRMDGFELLSRIRAAGKWRDLPVVLVTSLSSAGERARGLALGANGYIAKGEFDAGRLLRFLGDGE